MPTLIEYFNNDFGELSLDSDLIMTIQKLDSYKNPENGEKVIIKKKVRHNLNSSCRTFTFYVSERNNTLSIIGNIIENLYDHQKQAQNVVSIGAYENDLQIGTHENVFSKRIYFYTESELTNEEVTRLDDFCKQEKIFVTVRSQNYIKTRMENEIPLAFISHDSRNKAAIAKPLAIGLSSRLCSVWYDEFSLKVGQSLRESIRKGLRKRKNAYSF